MDNPLAVDAAVQGATGVTLEIQRKRITERTQSRKFTELIANAPFLNEVNAFPLASHVPFYSQTASSKLRHELARL